MNTRRLSLAPVILAIAAAGSVSAQAQPAAAEQAGAPFAHGPGHAVHATPNVPAPSVPAPNVQVMPAPAMPAIDPQVRAAWVAECERRLAGPDLGRWERKRDRRDSMMRSREACATYFDDYYTYHARAWDQYRQHYAHTAAMAATAGRGCCHAAPLSMQPRGERVCTETVEYVEVPVRPRARRVVPDKRIRVAPDKRVRVQ